MVSPEEICRLPRDVRSILRSGILVHSVPQCVEELVLNAIDAEATCVAVRVDLIYFRITVVDNGKGITGENLEHVGNRYHTSKCHSLKELQNSLATHGFRGEALASIGDSSGVLDVTSRAKESKSTYTKLFTYGKAHKVRESSTRRPAHGTTVSVQDFLYNLPVRRNAISEGLTLEEIRHCIEAIALVQPNVSFTLRNDVTGEKLLQTHVSPSMLDSFRHLFGGAKAQNLLAISSSHIDGKSSIMGYVSRGSHPSKRLQFIYVNKRLVLHTRMHRTISKLLKSSAICRNGPKQQLDDFNKLSESPSKRGEKYPVFVINLNCPPSTYDVTYDPRKTQIEFKEWDAVIHFLETSINKFLVSNQLALRKVDEVKVDQKRKNATEAVSNPVFANLIPFRELPSIRQSLAAQRVPESSLTRNPFRTPTKDLEVVEPSFKTPVGIGQAPKREKSNSFDENIRGLSTMGKAMRMIGGGSTLKKFKPAGELRTTVKFADLSTLLNRFRNVKANHFTAIKPHSWEKEVPESSPCRLVKDSTEKPETAVINQHADSDNCSEGVMEIGEIVHDKEIDQNMMESLPILTSVSTMTMIIRPKEPECSNASVQMPVIEPMSSESSNTSPSIDSQQCVLRPDRTSLLKRFASRRAQAALKSPIRGYENDVEKVPSTEPASPEPRRNCTEINMDNLANTKMSNPRKLSSQSSPSLDAENATICEPQTANLATELTLGAIQEAEQIVLPRFECEMNALDSLAPFSSCEDEGVVWEDKDEGNKYSEYRWIQSTDANDRQVYVNAHTGEVSKEIPYLSMASVVNINQLLCLPPRLKHLMEDFTKEFSAPIKPARSTEGDLSSRNGLQSLVREYVDAMQKDHAAEMKWRNPEEIANTRWDFQRAFVSTDVLNCGGHSIPLLVPTGYYKFDKDIFNMFRVVGQADNKFIACLVSGEPLSKVNPLFSNSSQLKNPTLNMLVLFDQHAVHERIRLEQLMEEHSKLYTEESNILVVESVSVTPPVVLHLSPEELRLMKIYGRKLERFALVCEIDEDETVSLCKIPACFVIRETSEVRHGRNSVYLPLVMEMIREELDFLKETRGALRFGLPNAVRNVLNSLACRGAVKFGDTLSIEQCQQLIESLKSCDLPFQCAHGRPVIAPVVNLSELDSQISVHDQPSKRVNFGLLKRTRKEGYISEG